MPRPRSSRALGFALLVVSTVVVGLGGEPAEAKNYGASRTEWRLSTTTGPYGQPFALHVFVVDDSTSCDLPPYPYGCNTPTGTMYFFVDGNPGYSVRARVEPFDADFSTVRATISNLAPGPHTIRALYVGGVSSVSNPRPFRNSEATIGITITQAKVTGGIASNLNPSLPGQPVTFSISVAPNPPVDTAGGAVLPTGTVQFVDITAGGNSILASAPLTGGSASHTVSTLPLGTRRIAGVYLGDANYEARSLGVVDQVVGKARPTVSVQASPGGLLGAPVHATAFVSGGLDPTGTVTLRLFSDPACATEVFVSTKALVGGTATSDRFTPAAPGTYHWIAGYNGDALNDAVLTACGTLGGSVTIRPFAAPAFTRVVRGDLRASITVGAGESVLVEDGRVLGSVTVQPGGALTVVNSRIRGPIVADAPGFFSLCGTWVDGRAPEAVSVTGAPVPVRVGDPAAGCAGNDLSGSLRLAAGLAVTAGGNRVLGGATVDGHGPGNTIVAGNEISATLACAGNAPPPANRGLPNTATSRLGQCAAL